MDFRPALQVRGTTALVVRVPDHGDHVATWYPVGNVELVQGPTLVGAFFQVLIHPILKTVNAPPRFHFWITDHRFISHCWFSSVASDQ